MYRINKFLFPLFVSVFFILPVAAQTQQKPLTSNEVVRLLYELPRSPEKRDEIVEEIRRRGIGFPLTDGMRSLVATKSGNDPLLRRTLEEAERRRVNPTASALPSDTEAHELLERTRNVTLAAANAMPDFIVKQIIRRSVAYGRTTNWQQQDTLTIAVGYRAEAGEEYKLLTVNGRPAPEETKAGSDYSKYAPRGASSTGEYISALASVFKPESRTEFKLVDTDMVQNRRTIVYEYTIKREFSSMTLSVDGMSMQTTAGSRGRVWIDRELDRVLRFEQIATEIPRDFPIQGATSVVDYDWVTINERKYLLPSQSQIILTSNVGTQALQSRNDIRFRSYQKFGAELKVIDEVGEDDETPPPPPPPRRPH